MKTRTSGTERSGRTGGFTLFELLAVITIIAIVAATVSFGTARSLGTAHFRAVLSSTSAILRQARSRAISTASGEVVVVDIDGRRIGIPATGQAFDIPKEIDLTATVAESEHYPDGTVGVRFFADGSSTGGTLAFGWGNQRYDVEVNWLTGNVAIRQSS